MLLICRFSFSVCTQNAMHLPSIRDAGTVLQFTHLCSMLQFTHLLTLSYVRRYHATVYTPAHIDMCRHHATVLHTCTSCYSYTPAHIDMCRHHATVYTPAHHATVYTPARIDMCRHHAAVYTPAHHATVYTLCIMLQFTYLHIMLQFTHLHIMLHFTYLHIMLQFTHLHIILRFTYVHFVLHYTHLHIMLHFTHLHMLHFTHLHIMLQFTHLLTLSSFLEVNESCLLLLVVSPLPLLLSLPCLPLYGYGWPAVFRFQKMTTAKKNHNYSGLSRIYMLCMTPADFLILWWLDRLMQSRDTGVTSIQNHLVHSIMSGFVCVCVWCYSISCTLDPCGP
jgi:hypothetical protein